MLYFILVNFKIYSDSYFVITFLNSNFTKLNTAENATIDNTDAPKIIDSKANFTTPGQTITYSFYVIMLENMMLILTL